MLRAVLFAIGVAGFGVAGWLWTRPVAEVAVASPAGESERADFSGPTGAAAGKPRLDVDIVDDNVLLARVSERHASTLDRLGSDFIQLVLGGSGRLEYRLSPLVDELRAMLHRYPDESDEAYRERIRQFISDDLEGPRRRMDSRRRTAEAEAGVSAEQHAELDEILDDTVRSVEQFTAESVQSGELPVDHLTWAAAMSFAGGWGTALSSANQRISEVLTAEQRDALSRSGWDWAEYAATRVGWENLPIPPGLMQPVE